MIQANAIAKVVIFLLILLILFLLIYDINTIGYNFLGD